MRRLDLGDGSGAYLFELHVRATEESGGYASHVLFGGRARVLPLRTRRGLWPARLPTDDAFRLIGSRTLEPGSHADFDPVRPHVVRRVRVDGRRALLLRVEPFPDGGIHGGHFALVWNDDGHGYVLSLHFAEHEQAAPSPRELRTLLRAARSFG